MNDEAEPSPGSARPHESSGTRSFKGRVPLREVFVTFLLIGVTSFGGGVVAYLRNTLVHKKRWLTDDEFLTALEISQALPGLNGTNMAVIVGDRLRGPRGSVLAFLGICLPGIFVISGLSVVYVEFAGNSHVTSVLVGVGAASVGLLAAVTLQVGGKQLRHFKDIMIIAVTVVLVAFLHVSMIIVVPAVGLVAVLMHRPHKTRVHERDRSGLDKRPVD